VRNFNITPIAEKIIAVRILSRVSVTIAAGLDWRIVLLDIHKL
jgi:hypothetical protein